VNSQIEDFRKYSKLVDTMTNEVTPFEINSALACYTDVGVALNGEYQRKKIEHNKLLRLFEEWYDEKLVETRKRLQEESTSKSIKASLKEIESELRYNNKEKYYELQEQITEAESSVSFVLRLIDQWKKHSDILINLSQNMRTELRSLSIENRVNSMDNVRLGFPDRPKRRLED